MSLHGGVELRPKVYAASGLWHALMWQRLRDDYPDIVWTSKWVDQMLERGRIEDNTFSQEQNMLGWIQAEADVRSSDIVLCYAQLGDFVRGALVEAGMGIALGKRIICCGESPAFGTWQYHPMVLARVETLAEAMPWIMRWARGAS